MKAFGYRLSAIMLPALFVVWALCIAAAVTAASSAERQAAIEDALARAAARASPAEGAVSRPQIQVMCDVCEAAVELANTLIRLNFTEKEMEAPFIAFCNKFIFPHSEHPMCPGLISSYGPPVIYILSSALLQPSAVCQELRYCNSSTTHVARPPQDERPQHVPAALEKLARERTYPHRHQDRSRMPSVVRDAPTLRILHLTDFHYDELYTPGAYADCGDINCCRANDFNGTRRAGPFGDYLCDVPRTTAESMLAFAAAMQPPIDVILWTGDNPSHDMWMETPASQLDASRNVTRLIRQYFPRTPVVPVYGNHEGFPANLYYQPTYGWLMQGLADAWRPFLTADAYQTMSYAGYYTMLLRPGVRAIVLNSQLGYLFNFYTLLPDHSVAEEMFIWAEKQLQEAAAAGERVLMIGHIPPGREDVNNFFAARYVDLAQRYAQVIVGHFTGHIHEDSFEVIRDAQDALPVGVVYIAPSVTTFWNVNPSFRVYEVDAQSWDVLNFEQYNINLTQANAEGRITWELFYDARSLWQMPDLSPQSWQLVNDAIRAQSDTAALYQYVFNTARYPMQPCDDLCRRMSACETGSATFQMYSQCILQPTS